MLRHNLNVISGKWRVGQGQSPRKVGLNEVGRVQGGPKEVLTLPQESGCNWKQEMGSFPPEACREEGDPLPIQRGHIYNKREVPAHREQRVNHTNF